MGATVLAAHPPQNEGIDPAIQAQKAAGNQNFGHLFRGGNPKQFSFGERIKSIQASTKTNTPTRNSLPGASELAACPAPAAWWRLQAGGMWGPLCSICDRKAFAKSGTIKFVDVAPISSL